MVSLTTSCLRPEHQVAPLTSLDMCRTMHMPAQMNQAVADLMVVPQRAALLIVRRIAWASRTLALRIMIVMADIQSLQAMEVELSTSEGFPKADIERHRASVDVCRELDVLASLIPNSEGVLRCKALHGTHLAREELLRKWPHALQTQAVIALSWKGFVTMRYML